MPRKKTDVKTDPAADTPADTKVLLSTEDVPDTVDDLLAELEKEADSAVCIRKVMDSGEEAECFSVGPHDVTWPQLVDRIRLEFGAGKYWARGRVGSLWKGRKKILIASARNALGPAAPAAAAPQAGSDMKLFMDMMRAQQEQTTRLLESMIKTNAAPATAGLGFADVISAAKLLKGDPRNPLEDVKATAELVNMLAQQGGGGDKGETNSSDVLIALLNSAPGLIEGIKAAQLAPPPKPGGAPAAAKLAAVAAPARHPLAPAVALLLKGARKGSDPQSYADVALDLAGAPALTAIVAAPDPVELLAAVNPDVKQHAEWFAEFIEAAKEALAPEEDPEPPTSAAPAQPEPAAAAV